MFYNNYNNEDKEFLKKYDKLLRKIVNNKRYNKFYREDLLQEARILALRYKNSYNPKYRASMATYLYNNVSLCLPRRYAKLLGLGISSSRNIGLIKNYVENYYKDNNELPTSKEIETYFDKTSKFTDNLKKYYNYFKEELSKSIVVDDSYLVDSKIDKKIFSDKLINKINVTYSNYSELLKDMFGLNKDNKIYNVKELANKFNFSIKNIYRIRTKFIAKIKQDRLFCDEYKFIYGG